MIVDVHLHFHCVCLAVQEGRGLHQLTALTRYPIFPFAWEKEHFASSQCQNVTFLNFNYTKFGVCHGAVWPTQLHSCADVKPAWVPWPPLTVTHWSCIALTLMLMLTLALASFLTMKNTFAYTNIYMKSSCNFTSINKYKYHKELHVRTNAW